MPHLWMHCVSSPVLQCKELTMRLENKVQFLCMRPLPPQPRPATRPLMSCAQDAELRDLKPRLESKQVGSTVHRALHGVCSLFSWQEAVEELLTKQRGDIKLLREAEAKVLRHCSIHKKN